MVPTVVETETRGEGQQKKRRTNEQLLRFLPGVSHNVSQKEALQLVNGFTSTGQVEGDQDSVAPTLEDARVPNAVEDFEGIVVPKSEETVCRMLE